jgi:hypothetical protein
MVLDNVLAGLGRQTPAIMCMVVSSPHAAGLGSDQLCDLDNEPVYRLDGSKGSAERAVRAG